MAIIIAIMEFIFRFNPQVNLIILTLMMFALWFALGGIATAIERIVKGVFRRV